VVVCSEAKKEANEVCIKEETRGWIVPTRRTIIIIAVVVVVAATVLLIMPGAVLALLLLFEAHWFVDHTIVHG
jgi:hypothetical protein